MIDNVKVWPDVNQKITKRLKECLIMLCCGFKTESIGKNLHISKSTVENHLQTLYDIFHVDGREALVSMAWCLEIVTKEDIQFYDNKIINFPLPDWAVEKRNYNRRIAV